MKPEWLLEERWRIQPSNLQNLKSDSLSNTWKTTLPSPWLEGKNEKLAYARWRFLASKIGLGWFSPIPSCSFCKTHKEHIWGHFSELATVSAFEGNHMDTNKATMDEGLGIPGVQKQDAWAWNSRSSLEPGLGPRIIPIVTRFGYLIKFGCNNNKKLGKCYIFLLIRPLLLFF